MKRALLFLLLWPGLAVAQDPPLALEATIPLPGVGGRIDHMAFDAGRKRLIVAELGNGSVEIVDLTARKPVHRITGLKEPQGVEYIAQGDLIAVACGGDGMVRFFRAADFAPAGQVALGDDADDMHLEPQTGHLLVGYGSGGIAVIDPAQRKKIGDIPMPWHPEGFQARDGRVFVNVPDGDAVVVATENGRASSSWPTGKLSENFPMALSGDGRQLALVYRSPARLQLRDPAGGREIAAVETCGDSDDVFFDDRRQRLYVSCGAGALDVFAMAGLQRLGRIQTRWGARTSLFVPAMDRLFVAERAGLLGSDATVTVYRPVP